MLNVLSIRFLIYKSGKDTNYCLAAIYFLIFINQADGSFIRTDFTLQELLLNQESRSPDLTVAVK